MLIILFLVSHFNYLFIPCGTQSWLPVSDISVTETITETEIIDRALTKTETETMLIYETEII